MRYNWTICWQGEVELLASPGQMYHMYRHLLSSEPIGYWELILNVLLKHLFFSSMNLD